MRKYILIYKCELLSTLQYMVNILFRLVNFIFLIFIFMNLWGYMYDNPNELINGYSKNQMIWYVIITEILWGATDGRRYCRRIANDVRGGNIAYMINKPYSYIGYAISSHLGETTIKTLISIATGITMGIIFLKEIPVKSVSAFVVVVLSGILAVLINSLLVTFIGLISFIIEDSNPLFWLYSKMILVLGVLFPIEYFPGVFAQIMRYSPIYVTCYGPAKLFVDFSYQAATEILIAQIFYLGIAWIMCYAMYKKGVKKLNVTGG